MKIFLSIIFVLLVVTNASAQTPSTATALPGATIGSSINGTALPMQAAKNPMILSKPLSPTVAYKYYDPTLPEFVWFGHGLYNPYVLLFLGERITLSTDMGYVDSVAVTLDSINMDSVHISLFPDTLLSTSQGDFHLINIFDQNAVPYAEGPAIQSTQIHGRTRLVIPFPHVQVPKEFFVMLAPTVSAQGAFTNFFYLPGDQEPTRTRTAENARAAWVGDDVTTNQTLSGVLDGTFSANGKDPLYTNFYITAYVQEGQSGVASVERGARSISASPNPFHGLTQVRYASPTGGDVTFTAADLLGRQIAELPATRDGDAFVASFDASKLSAGTYVVLAHTSDGVHGVRVVNAK